MQLPMAPAPDHPSSPFAPLQARWMDELFKGPLPPERLATCSDCAKLTKPGALPDPDAYNPDTKCCTYLPMLHNFLVGAMLDDESPDFASGKATVQARIDAGLAVTPLGLYATEEYLARYDAGVRFGKDLSLRCPHYLHLEGGKCGVWRHRESTCSTWFCNYERGELGKDFWKRGVAPMLRAAELSLAQHCAAALGAGESDWGRWEGEPRALYRACAQLAAELSWAQVEAIGGQEVKRLARESREQLLRVRTA
jgi:hypothetical protein